MTDAELRALVRQAVARHMGTTAAAPPDPRVPLSPAHAAPYALPAAGSTGIAHAMYLTLVNVGDACLIEPAVACNHCGYCKTHGH